MKNSIQRKNKSSNNKEDPKVPNKQVSARRLRVGIVMIVLFWLPFWLIAPALDKIAGANTATEKHNIFLAVVLLQSLLGIMGVVIAGKTVLDVVRHTKRKRIFIVLWRTLKTGEMNT